MKLFAIRHAPPENTNVYCDDDTPIKEGAVDLVKEARGFLKKHAMKVFASPQPRAQQTVQLITAEYETDVRLCAKSYGALRDKPKNVTLRDKFFKRPQGGENYLDVLNRTRDFLNSVKEPAVIVTHDSTVKTLAAICEVDPELFLAAFPYGKLIDVSAALRSTNERAANLVHILEAE
jgi:broad specificity phosphatase PhoE